LEYYRFPVWFATFVAPKIGFSFWRKLKLSKKMYVGNLPFETTEDDVRELFEEYGEIESVAMITDRDSGRFRGFCFVEMDNAAASAAIAALDGKDYAGRDLRVNEARPREERSGGGNRGGNRGRGGYNSRSRFPDSGGRY
jgi:RNA recognition motif-containing protein